MKYNKLILGLILVPIILAGCTSEFEERNTDPTRLTSLDPDDVKGLFPSALYESVGKNRYQEDTNLFADMYAQYFAGTQTAFSSHRYNMVQSWLRYQWINVYVLTMPAVETIIKETQSEEQIEESKNMNAIARVWKVYTLHRVTDYFGPIPYSHIGSDSIVIPYDSQKEIYYDFFEELSEASTILENNPNLPSFGEQDMIYKGDNTKWEKFANTLRLRLALRVSNVEPAKAREEAEAAVAGGVMTDESDDAFIEVAAPSNYNGLSRITAWNEFRMSANMESLLVGYEDPRLSEYFEPAKNTGEYKGVRSGMIPAEQTQPENGYDNASNVSKLLQADRMFVQPITVMYSAEAYFLRAEGALNGWNMGGTAEELYGKGIEMSLRTWGITDEAVINNYINSSNIPMAPGGYFNTPPLTDIPVKYSADPEKQREQIATQKWLALFPDGHEAWAEMRRADYPKFYALIHSDNPNVTPKEMASRIPFLEYDKERNGAAVEEAKALLDGPDNAATNLWWDVADDEQAVN